MNLNYSKIQANNVGAPLKVVKGHFATNHAHTNYYIDLTTAKARISEAQDIAAALCQSYLYTMVVDTIVCMEGTEVIGAFLAQELKKGGYISQNAHKTIYVTPPEFNSSGQMIFKDNFMPMIKGKNVVILTTAVRTGLTALKAVEGVEYFGGKVQCISAVFSAEKEVNGIPVVSVFDKTHIPDYTYTSAGECPICKEGKKLDAIINAYGFQKL